MIVIKHSILFSLGLAALCCLRAHGEETISFNGQIRPILSDNCFQCHGPDETHRKADLRLDQPEAAHEAAIVAGKPDDSEFFARITTDDADLRMPPEDSGKELTTEQIALLRKWVEQGAEYQPYWAYVEPVKHEVPAFPKKASATNWIDHFVLRRLADENLTLARPAGNATLVRRLYFDLIGLPPTPKQVARFTDNPTDETYEEIIDELLSSEHFGERMAMYWLDLVRYADTVGYHGDQDHSISPYRDWVIKAFNSSMPFDQFTRDQLAGDLLPNSTIEQQVASGYNRLLQTSHEGGVQPKEYLAIYAADRVRNVSAVWMGATVGCAQCHDHKYDPYTAEDFYALSAFFADLDEAQHFKVGGNSLPTNRPPEIMVLTPKDRKRKAELERQLKAAEAEGEDAQQDEIKELKGQIREIDATARKCMISVATTPREVRVLPRGDWLDDSGPVVLPAIPKFLGSAKSDGTRATRLDLASWLTDKDQAGGLTARVFANRFWYLLMGTGIAKVLDDFGGQGEPPVHPELLDNLAIEFVESGWDVKHMMKLIVMSDTYRQSSLVSAELRTRDPYNQLFARQSRYRLPAEMVRDNALAISGLLQSDVGGASVKPYQPGGYYRHLNFPTRRYSHDTDARQYRRGVYMHWQRQFLHPMLKSMDAPTREECTAERPRSNTPIAALNLLNDPTFVEAARKFAERIVKNGGDDDMSRLHFAYQQALSRDADNVEQTTLLKLLNDERERYRENAKAAKELLSVGQSPVDATIDSTNLAAWTSVARVILNLHETTTRN